MVETVGSLVALSDATAQLVERAAGSIVSVRGGGRWQTSGIHWRSGIIVTAEEVLERDEKIELTLHGGRSVEASLVGRDPTTDVAVLRFRPDGLPTAATAKAPLRAGEAIFAVGNHDGTALAAFGIVALASGAWRSSRGGTIDEFLRLDLSLSPAGEGGALIDVQGRVLGMTVLGPRRRLWLFLLRPSNVRSINFWLGVTCFGPTSALVYAPSDANADKTTRRPRAAGGVFWWSTLIRRDPPRRWACL